MEGLEDDQELKRAVYRSRWGKLNCERPTLIARLSMHGATEYSARLFPAEKEN